MLLRKLLRLRLLPSLLWLCLFHPASAETWTEIPVDVVLDPSGQRGGRVSPVFSRDIKGSGYLNFAELVLEGTSSNNNPLDDVTLDATIVFLKKKPSAEETSVFVDEYIGVTAKDGSTEYCCTHNSQRERANLCRPDQIGQLIVNSKHNENIAKVQHRSFGTTNGSAGMAGVVVVDETEHVVLVFGHCNDEEEFLQQTVRISGPVIWVSYVSPRTLPLQVVLLLLTGGLAVWYHRLMKIHADSRIQIEEWILKVLVLAAAAVASATLVIILEVYEDDEPVILEFGSDVLRAVALVAGRCLYLVLAMGLGVTTSQLSTRTNSMLVVCLGANTLGLAAIAGMDFVARNSVIALFENLVVVCDAVFLVWIPCATCRTMAYLQRNGEELKLVRYRWILKIYYLIVFLSLLQFGLFFGDMVTSGGRRYDMESVREGNLVIHFVLLWCVAYLWKPNPSQQQYAYVLLEDDDDDGCEGTHGTTDLELTEVVQDEDDEDDVIIDNNEGGFRDDDDENRVV